MLPVQPGQDLQSGSGKWLWLPANLSVRLKVDCCFLSHSSFMVFCIPLVRARERAHIRRLRTGSPGALLLPPVLCASEVSESSCERCCGRCTPGTPCICCLKSSGSSSHASLDPGYFPKLAHSLWWLHWLTRVVSQAPVTPVPTTVPKSPVQAAGALDWIRSEAYNRPYEALKILTACSTETVIVQCLSQMMLCLLKAATPTQLIH